MRNAGYLTSNANTAWPFDGDSPTLDRDVARLFADGAVLIYPNDGADGACIRDVSVSGGVLSFTVCKTNGGSEKGSVGMRIEANDGVYSVSSMSWCFFVAECKEIFDHDGLVAEGPFAIDPAACSMEPERVTSISLYNHDPGSTESYLTDAGIKGDVSILAGYNTYVGTDLGQAGYVTSVPGREAVNGIVIAAGAGLGLGRTPCDDSNDCDSNDFVPHLGNVRPDSEGNVVFESDQCYQISPDEHRWYQVIHHKTAQEYIDNVHLLLQGRCTACCQCDDFVAINNRLAEQSVSVIKSYNDLTSGAAVYNDQAERFNERLNEVKTEELVARCVVMGQNYTHGAAHAQNLGSISGSLDRSQAVISLKNLSAKDVTALVVARMRPQSIVMANVLTPNGTGETWTKVDNEVIECHGEFVKRDIHIPAGSGVTIRLYGARGSTTTPSKECMVDGFVLFSWKEEIECPPPDESNEWPDFSNDCSNDMKWHTAFIVDSNDSNDDAYDAHFGDFLPEHGFPEPDVDMSLGSNDSNDEYQHDLQPIVPDEQGKCWITKSLRRELTVSQRT